MRKKKQKENRENESTYYIYDWFWCWMFLDEFCVMPKKPKTHSQRLRESSPFKAFYERQEKVYKQKHDKKRGTASQRGYTSRWRKASKTYLVKHPLCVECLTRGITKDAECVDHIIPHKGNWELFWDVSNWQSLCKPCHDRKTARGE